MYTGDPGGAGKGLTDGRMMVPRGKMLGGSSGPQLHGLRARSPRRLRRLGGRGRQGLVLRRRAARTSSRARTSRRPTRRRASSSTTTSTAPAARSGCRCARRAPSRPSSSSRPPRRPGSRWGTTTAATAVARPGVPRCSRPPPATASAPRPSTPSSSRRWTGRTSRSSPHAQVEQLLLESDGRRAARHRRRATATPTAATTTLHADREVVVSAGAIGSPQLLLLSGIGPTRRARRGRCRLRARQPARRQAPQGPPARAAGVPGTGRRR